MPSNQFVPYGTGAGANTLSPAAYAATPARQTGVVSGPASSTLANTSWRQASEMAAMLGAFIVAKAGLDANDDGDIGTLLNSFVAAIGATSLAQFPTTALVHAGADTSNAPNSIVLATVNPDISTLTNYQIFEVVPTNSNTDTTSLSVKNFGTLPLQRANGGNLQNGDAPAGEPFLVMFFNNTFRRLAPVRSEIISSVSNSTTIVPSGSINPITNSGAYILTPTGNQNFTRDLTFTAPSNGVVLANGVFFTSNSASPTDANGNGPVLNVSVIGNTSGTQLQTGSTTNTIAVPTTKTVSKNELVTVRLNLIFPNTAAPFPASQTGMSYIFVPSA